MANRTVNGVTVNKGAYKGECARPVCKESPAVFNNRSTCKYYCRQCAFLINRNMTKDTLMGNEPLCVEVVDV